MSNKKEIREMLLNQCITDDSIFFKELDRLETEITSLRAEVVRLKRFEDVLWMPHAGHFICGSKCRFTLNTYVNGYIVSTVGEYIPDSGVRNILRKSRGRETPLRGDAEEDEFGFEEIGLDRLYETMVFKAKPSEHACCPYEMVSGNNIDFMGYNDPDKAYKGHLTMVKRYTQASEGGEKGRAEMSQEMCKHIPKADKYWVCATHDMAFERCPEGMELLISKYRNKTIKFDKENESLRAEVKRLKRFEDVLNVTGDELRDLMSYGPNEGTIIMASNILKHLRIQASECGEKGK